MRAHYKIKGMSCAVCQATIQKKVQSLKGVNEASVNLVTEEMDVVYDEAIISAEAIKQAVDNLGYTALYQDQQLNDEKKDLTLVKLIVSLVLAAILMYVSMGHMIKLPLATIIHNTFELSIILQIILSVSLISINFHYFKKGFISLVKGHPNMDTLISSGSTSAFLYSMYVVVMCYIYIYTDNLEMFKEYSMNLYFESSGVILALVSLGKYFEHHAKSKSQDAIYSLVKLCPKDVTVLAGGVEKTISATELEVGDVIVVKPGDVLPIDGKIISGSTYLNEATITGEANPVFKKENDLVISSTINQTNKILVEATTVGSDTTFAKIIKLVEEASNSKPPIARLADTVSSYFVPIVLLIALGTFITWMIISGDLAISLERAISTLVIACPCSLGLATPLAVMVGVGIAAKNGIIIKDASSLEILSKVKTIAYDKTGTITKGKPVVKKVLPEAKMDYLYILSSLEANSLHPLAKTITSTYNNHLYNVSDYMEKTGYGISGVINGQTYYAGNVEYLKEYHSNIPAYIDLTYTNIILFTENEVLLQVLFEDEINISSHNAIASLQNINQVMLTGDNIESARRIASNVGIDNIIAGVDPKGKRDAIINLKEQSKGYVAMIGDGVNDTVALMQADIGIAIGNATDAAMESADVVLVGTTLEKLPLVIKLGHKVFNNIKTNLFWAFFYNIIGIVLATGALAHFGIKLTPMVGSLAMCLSSVTVVLNALSLNLKFRKKEKHKMETYKISIEGMACKHCQARVQSTLEKVNGITSVNVDLENKCATFETDNKALVDECIRIVNELGYTATK